MSRLIQMMPGIGSLRTASHRALFLQKSETFLAGGKLIDGTLARDPGNTPDVAVLRIGLIMGKVTSSGYYANSILDTLISGGTAGSVALTISAAGAVELVRRQGASGTFNITGPAVANGTINTETVTYSAVNTTTGVITCTGTVNPYVAGSFIQPTDGSQVPLNFIPDTQGYGIYVLDQDGVSLATVEFPRFPVSGIVAASQLLPVWPTDTSLQNWLLSRFNDVFGGQFVFDAAYG